MVQEKLVSSEKTKNDENVYRDEPELRFPEFNDEWIYETLEHLSIVKDGTHDSPKYHSEGFPLITSKNLLTNGKLDKNNVNLISKEDFDKINKRSKVDKGDILFGMIGTIGNPVIVEEDEFAIKNVALIKEKGYLKNSFLIHVLDSDIIKKQFYKLNAGGTQKFIALNLIRNLEVPKPSLNEQEKISIFLSLIDKKIELLEKKHSSLKDFKKYMIENRFFNETLIKDNIKSFNTKQLGDICEVYGRIGFRGYTVDDLVEKGEGALTIGGKHINKNFKLDLNEPEYLSWEKYDESPEIKVKNGDILFVKTASVGKLCIIENLNEPATINPQLVLLKNIAIENKFLYYYLTSNIFQKEIHKIKSSTGIPTITQKEFKNIILYIPETFKQKYISNILSSIDNKESIVLTNLNLLKDFKKGLLQKMFV